MMIKVGINFYNKKLDTKNSKAQTFTGYNDAMMLRRIIATEVVSNNMTLQAAAKVIRKYIGEQDELGKKLLNDFIENMLVPRKPKS